jgi:glycosyltransferase involved in cell wall biosynthesis
MATVAPQHRRQAAATAQGVPPDETVYVNHLWPHATPHISICVPVYKVDAAPLVGALSKCVGSALAELIVYDDGSGTPGLIDALQLAADSAAMPVRIVSASFNVGRAAARNHAIAHARSQWVLLLDADMWPDSGAFIQDYVAAAQAAGRPALIVGGYSLAQASQEKRYRLHRWQSQASECVPSAVRRKSPGRYVFTSNVLAHKRVLEACPFDEGFTGWGWEDTDWGLRAEQAFPVLHIDNTATHLGLDDASSLMGKYQKSGANFARVAARHANVFADTPLLRAARMARSVPVRGVIRRLVGFVARDPFGLAPIGLRGRALKAWRAFLYAEHLR